MSGFHQRMRNMVIRQLALQPKGKGVAITLAKRTGGYDPDTGDSEPVKITEYVSSGIRVNYKDSSYRNTTYQFGDFQIYLSPVQDNGDETPKPEVGDRLTFLDLDVRAVSVEPFNENGYGCGWKIQVRHG